MPLYMPELYEEESSRSVTATFLGLNQNLRIADGEWYDMKNLTSDHAPVMAVRDRRFIPRQWETVKPVSISAGVYGKGYGGTGGVVWIDGTFLRLSLGSRVDLSEYGYRDDGTERHIVRLGAYIIVVPDMIYVNTVELSDCGRIEDRVTANPDSTFTVRVTDSEGELPRYVQSATPEGTGNLKPPVTVVINQTASSDGETGEEGGTEATAAETGTEDTTEVILIPNGALWHKIGSNSQYANGLYRYDADAGKWYAIQSYLKIMRTDPSAPTAAWGAISFKKELRAGDAIRISGIHESVNGVHLVHGIEEFTHLGVVATAIIVEGSIDAEFVSAVATDDSPIILERVIPRMDYVIEAGNRLWGCRYGDDGQGNFVNEIYCSARGDFYRWILGASDNEDSPVTFSIGTDGAWTGAVNYDGYPTFFKERVMHRVSGSGASGFALYDTPCNGVDVGAHRSLAVVGNVLYYKSSSAIMGFDGSVPVSVSDKLGRLTGYEGAVGGASGGKYYVSLWKEDAYGTVSAPVLYVLDTDKGLWHKEDELECESMAGDRDNLYMIAVNRSGDEVTHTIQAVSVPDEVGGLPVASTDVETERIPWYAETGIIGLETPDAKYMTKIAIRLQLDTGATVRVSVQYDSVGTWKQISAADAPRMRTVTMPIVPARCDHMRMRLDGVGGCRIFSITKTFEAAEDL